MASRMDEREVLRVLGQLYYRLRGTTRALGLNDKDYPRTLPQGVKPIKNREPLDERDLVRFYKRFHCGREIEKVHRQIPPQIRGLAPF